MLVVVALLLSPLAASANGGSSPTEMETLPDAELQILEGGLTERQFGCGLAVASLIIGTAALGPGYLVAFGWSITLHGALFACF